MDILITKADGTKEPFVEEKLRASLRRCGAKPTEIDKVAEHIKDELEEGMTTHLIYKHAFFILRKLKNPDVIRKYSLRRALMELGPTGFPFEKYLGELMKERGYEVALNQIVKGACVSHEMDVVAYNESKLIMIESKFHNELGEKSDLKIILYIKARFDDLIDQPFEYGRPRVLDEGWLVTNTKFTENAIKYGQCAGVRMIGWNYPQKDNLESMIEDSGLHPITCLQSLSSVDRQLLLSKGMILCKQVRLYPRELEALGFDKGKTTEILAEADLICQPYGSN